MINRHVFDDDNLVGVRVQFININKITSQMNKQIMDSDCFGLVIIAIALILTESQYQHHSMQRNCYLHVFICAGLIGYCLMFKFSVVHQETATVVFPIHVFVASLQAPLLGIISFACSTI